MLLTLDIGNTTVGVYGVERTGDGDYQIRFSEKFPTLRKGADYFPLLRALWEREGREAVEGIVFSSVVPSLDGPVSRAAERLLGKTPVKIRPEGLTFAIPHPERLGLDRIAGAAWAVRRYPLAAVTVDLGTATTFNVLDKAGVFLGGVIAPGVETGIAALSARTAQLPAVDPSLPARLIGRNTEEAMRSGAVVGTAAMVDGIAARVETELGQPVSLILTGGWAHAVGPLCRYPHTCDPWLLPKGLACLYDLTTG